MKNLKSILPTLAFIFAIGLSLLTAKASVSTGIPVAVDGDTNCTEVDRCEGSGPECSNDARDLVFINMGTCAAPASGSLVD